MVFARKEVIDEELLRQTVITLKKLIGDSIKILNSEMMRDSQFKWIPARPLNKKENYTPRKDKFFEIHIENMHSSIRPHPTVDEEELKIIFTAIINLEKQNFDLKIFMAGWKNLDINHTFGIPLNEREITAYLGNKFYSKVIDEIGSFLIKYS